MDALRKSKKELVEEIQSLRLRLDDFEQKKSTSKQPKSPMEENEGKFRLLCEKAPLPYQSLDKNGCLIDVNLAWLEVLGYKR